MTKSDYGCFPAACTRSKVKKAQTFFENRLLPRDLREKRPLWTRGPPFQCIICTDDDVEEKGVLECGHEYCYECIARWANAENTCPQCKAKFYTIRRRAMHRPIKCSRTERKRHQNGSFDPEWELIYNVSDKNQRIEMLITYTNLYNLVSELPESQILSLHHMLIEREESGLGRVVRAVLGERS
eukprot:GHVL01025202.1.p1 GENE.GHVL01025202.1~~GHVL01025202.1.p1  ORF type:complete len:184 (-),score=29.62 GHVL01025202.1:64-615(-)